MTDAELRKIVKKALRDYHKTGARELPSVAGPKSRGVPRSFLSAVDNLTDALKSALADRA